MVINVEYVMPTAMTLFSTQKYVHANSFPLPPGVEKPTEKVVSSLEELRIVEGQGEGMDNSMLASGLACDINVSSFITFFCLFVRIIDISFFRQKW